MKTKIIILIAVSALITLSFTFKANTINSETVNHTTEQEDVNKGQKDDLKPIGGFLSEDRL